jgi:hypothetical protein
LASHAGADEEKAFHKCWKMRGGQDRFNRFTGPFEKAPDAYVDLRKMVTKRAYLAKLSQGRTEFGLDTREAFFWAGPLVGTYLPMTWKAK